MLLFTISALRALVEMLGLCLIAQAFLYLISGPRRESNVIYRLFALITHPPRQGLAALLPAGTRPATVGVLCFVLLFCLWIGLAVLRRLLM